MVLLPDKLFAQIPSPTPQQASLFQRQPISINLIDLDLQRRIANSNDLDTEAIDAINLLLEKGPTNLRRDLEEWTTEEFEGKNVLFFQGKNYIPKDQELR